MTEGFQEKLNNLNELRKMFALPEIKVVEYNENFSEPEFESFISKKFNLIEKRHYGEYLFLSRIFYPLAILPESPKHDSHLNEVALNIAKKIKIKDLEKYSYNLFYVLQKK